MSARVKSDAAVLREAATLLERFGWRLPVDIQVAIAPSRLRRIATRLAKLERNAATATPTPRAGGGR